MRAALLSGVMAFVVFLGGPSLAWAQDEFEEQFGSEFGPADQDQEQNQEEQGQEEQGREEQEQPKDESPQQPQQPPADTEQKPSGQQQEQPEPPAEQQVGGEFGAGFGGEAAADQGKPQEQTGDTADTQASKQEPPDEAQRAEARGTTRAAGAPARGKEAQEEQVRARRFRGQNTVEGPIGGVRVVDAGGAAVGSFQLQLATELFFQEDFLRPGDSQERVGGTLSLSWTPFSFLELFASINARASDNSAGDPRLLQTLGDAKFGVKAFWRANPWFTIGGDASVEFLNTVGSVGLTGESTSFGFRANATADLRGLESNVPFVMRLNAQYWFDNSEELIEDVEDARFANLVDRRERRFEFRHLVTVEERFGLNINRTDFFNLGFGIEVPFEVMEGFFIHPLAEWTWGIPINRQGYDCLFLPPNRRTRAHPDSCLDQEGVSAFPMDVTVGFRVLPPVKGLSFLAAADVGVTGTNDFVRELAPNETYNIILGLSYAYDTHRPEPEAAPEPVVRTVEKKVEVSPVRGHVRGRVVEKGTDKPISGATIEFPERDVSDLLSDGEGNFLSYAFEPGKVRMKVSHPDYHDGKCEATIPDERPEEGRLEVEATCELEATPRKGKLEGQIVDEDGNALAGAKVKLMGPQTEKLESDEEGSFAVDELEPGTYNIRVQAEDYLVKLQELEIEANETAETKITLRARPEQKLVRVRKDRIQIRRRINFATGSSEIQDNSIPLMHQIADVLLRESEITKVEIQGHTDNRGSRQYNKDLSRKRAQSVRQWLVSHGIDPSRLTTKGFGESRPLVPNITPANRARNRRVEFHIKERKKETQTEE